MILTRGGPVPPQGPSLRRKSRSPQLFCKRLWYQHYPRKVSRGPAEKALRKALGSGVSLETLIEGDKRYTTQVAGSESDYIKQPATWLNGKCWRDEPEPRRGAEPDGELTWWQKRWLEEQVAAELNGT